MNLLGVYTHWKYKFTLIIFTGNINFLGLYYTNYSMHMHTILYIIYFNHTNWNIYLNYAYCKYTNLFVYNLRNF